MPQSMVPTKLRSIAENVWHVQHTFSVNGVPLSSRMTVLRLADGRLWLHSPVPIDEGLLVELNRLGKVAFIVAPSKTHHLYAADCAALFPSAQLLGPPGLRAKRPDLTTMVEVSAQADNPWRPELDFLLFEGIPLGNETVWFHHPSRTLILTDLCQWWQGELPFVGRVFAVATGVRQRMAVPRTIRALVKDRQAARRSADRVLQWPIERVVMAHNAVVEANARADLTRAFGAFR